MQLGNPPTAADPVHDAGADEVRPRPTEATRLANDAHGLSHVLPFATAAAKAIRQVQSIMPSPHTDRGYPLAFYAPMRTTYPTGAKAALPMEAVHIDRATGLNLGRAPEPA